jgi:DnaK suppressor protein
VEELVQLTWVIPSQRSRREAGSTAHQLSARCLPDARIPKGFVMSVVSVPSESAGARNATPNYRELLVTQWRAQLDDVTRLSIEVEAQREGSQPGAGGAGTEQARIAVRLLTAARRQMEETEAALRRLDKGLYGICDGCRLPIPAGRLDALPAARLCVGCQQAYRESAGDRS